MPLCYTMISGIRTWNCTSAAAIMHSKLCVWNQQINAEKPHLQRATDCFRFYHIHLRMHAQLLQMHSVCKFTTSLMCTTQGALASGQIPHCIKHWTGAEAPIREHRRSLDSYLLLQVAGMSPMMCFCTHVCLDLHNLKNNTRKGPRTSLPAPLLAVAVELYRPLILLPASIATKLRMSSTPCCIQKWSTGRVHQGIQ